MALNDRLKASELLLRKQSTALARAAIAYAKIVEGDSVTKEAAAVLLWKHSRQDSSLKEDLVHAACALLAGAATAPRRECERAEVAAFVDSLPASMSYSQMAAATEERFGPERAWTWSTVAHHWHAHHRVRKGTPSRLDADAEVRAFVEDLVGTMTLTKLAAACRDKFGPDRSPSSSAIHRHWLKLRAAASAKGGELRPLKAGRTGRKIP